ncbi:MAG: phenylacetate--CoA ligase [Deltaproteobacteria bacterium SM23_61]|nr:MAG: phenylacetate--CoA ligase [Deltaproteobacteria bacterium SM23_61]
MIWDRRNECRAREEVEQLQLERLQSTLNRVYRNVSFYKKRFDRLGITPDEIQSLGDLAQFPLTAKEDLRESYPYGMFALPLREVVRIHSSSGVTGKPTVTGYTRNDLQHWSQLTARVLSAGGVTKDDVVQIAFKYGLFTGAFGLHHGAELIGASVLPMSTGNTRKQVMIMQDYKTTALMSTPSYALLLARFMEKEGIDPKSLSLKLGLFGAEPWSESMRKEIEDRLFISATDNYGVSEVMGPGVSAECEHKNGLHLYEDHFIPEIIDPQTLKVLPPGAEGELVLTTLTKEAFPLVRYRTRDITSLDYAPCPCGRTLVRMKKVLGRSDDIIIIKGVNVFPSQVESILLEVEGVEPRYQMIADRVEGADTLELKVEVNERVFSDEIKNLQNISTQIEMKLRESVGVSGKVKLVAPESLQPVDGRAVKVIDRRKK